MYIEKILYFFSLSVFKDNLAMINQHNHEADIGLHSYTLKINQFADMVQKYILYCLISSSIILDTQRIRSNDVRWGQNAFTKI